MFINLVTQATPGSIFPRSCLCVSRTYVVSPAPQVFSLSFQFPPIFKAEPAPTFTPERSSLRLSSALLVLPQIPDVLSSIPATGVHIFMHMLYLSVLTRWSNALVHLCRRMAVLLSGWLCSASGWLHCQCQTSTPQKPAAWEEGWEELIRRQWRDMLGMTGPSWQASYWVTATYSKTNKYYLIVRAGFWKLDAKQLLELILLLPGQQAPLSQFWPST